MSYDLAVWHAARSLSVADARRVYERLAEDEIPGELTPAESLGRFAEELKALYAPLDGLSDRAAERSPWAMDPEIQTTHALLCLRPSRADRAGPKIRRLALKHGLMCYDPQANLLHLPAGFEPIAEPDPVDAAWEAYAQVLNGLDAGLSEHGYAWDPQAQCFLRGGADDRRILGLSLFRLATSPGGSSELRAAFTYQSWRLASFRISRQPRSYPGPDDLASVDVRRLTDPPEWLGWNLAARPDLGNGLAPAILRFFRERGFAYFDQVENPDHLVSSIPGVKPDDAIEYALALGRSDLAPRIARAFLERTPHDPAGFRGAVEAIRAGKEPPPALPFAIRAVASAVARHGLTV